MSAKKALIRKNACLAAGAFWLILFGLPSGRSHYFFPASIPLPGFLYAAQTPRRAQYPPQHLPSRLAGAAGHLLLIADVARIRPEYVQQKQQYI